MRFALCLALVFPVAVEATEPKEIDKKQEKAVMALADLGAKIERASKKPGAPVLALTCDALFGLDDEDLGWLRFLPNLHKVNLHNSGDRTLGHNGISDRGLRSGVLRSLKKLRHLTLSANNITDAGLEHLRGMIQLEYLSLADTKVTAAGVRMLQEALPKTKIVGP